MAPNTTTHKPVNIPESHYILTPLLFIIIIIIIIITLKDLILCFFFGFEFYISLMRHRVNRLTVCVVQ
jgi:hypothetical protein